MSAALSPHAQVRLIAALDQTERLVAAGCAVRPALEAAATRFAVGAGEVATRLLVRVIERDRARAALALLQAGDDDAGE